MQLTHSLVMLLVLALVEASMLAQSPPAFLAQWCGQSTPETIKEFISGFRCRGFQIALLDRDSSEHRLVSQYMFAGSPPSPSDSSTYTIYAIERDHEREAVRRWDRYGSRTLLWHGTPGENVGDILREGLRIAPGGKCPNGQMFGRGIYFTDAFSYSLEYAQPGGPKGKEITSRNDNKLHSTSNTPNDRLKDVKQPISQNKRYVFLCEVVLGTPKVVYHPEQVEGLPDGNHQSVKAVGRLGPDSATHLRLPDGCLVPLGPLVLNSPPALDNTAALMSFGDFWQPQKFSWNLQFNEYVVYDTTQIFVRYLVEYSN